MENFESLDDYDEIRLRYHENMIIRPIKVNDQGLFLFHEEDIISAIIRIDLVHCYPNGFAMNIESYYPAQNDPFQKVIARCELKAKEDDEMILSPLKVIHTYGGQYVTGPLSYIQMVGASDYKIPAYEHYGRLGTIWAMKK